MNPPKPRVALFALGLMGMGMARRLLDAGYSGPRRKRVCRRRPIFAQPFKTIGVDHEHIKLENSRRSGVHPYLGSCQRPRPEDGKRKTRVVFQTLSGRALSPAAR